MSQTAAPLRHLLDEALADGDAEALERYLLDHVGESRLPANFASQIARIVTAPDPPTERIEALLDGWAALSPDVAPDTSPRAILPAIALLTYGQVAISRPDWWDDELAKLRRGAADPRLRSSASVLRAMKQLLAADPTRTRAALREWQGSGHRQRATLASEILSGDRFPDMESPSRRER